ncbi:MAG: hypothetical protein AAGC77_05250 [Pseudomonadota bacterium]
MTSLPQTANPLALAETGSMPASPGLSAPRLTDPQKAALIIAALGPESAAPIVERISDSHLKAFARAYAHLATIPREQLLLVIKEFAGKFDSGSEEITGGFEQTRELLAQFRSQDEIARLMDDIDAPKMRFNCIL